VRLCGYAVATGQPCVIDIEDGIQSLDLALGANGVNTADKNQLTDRQYIGGSTGTANSFFFPSNGAWSGAGNDEIPAAHIPSATALTGTRSMDDLLIRAVDTSLNGRPIIAAPFISGALNASTTTNTNPDNVNKLPVGHIAFEGVRFYRGSGNNYAFEMDFAHYSETLQVTCADCHFTGPHVETTPFGFGAEIKMSVRMGYVKGLDLMDCQCGTAVEHFAYFGCTQGDSQVDRCRNTEAALFWPAHPFKTPYANKAFLGRTFVQCVSRHNQCNGPTGTSTGGGPWSHGNSSILIEDNVAHWVNGTSSGLTFVSTGMDIVVRRHIASATNGSAAVFIAWIVADHNGANSGAGNGWHGWSCNLGQMDGADPQPHTHVDGHAFPGGHGNAQLCGPSLQAAPFRPIPEGIPNSAGNIWATGHVLIEDFNGNTRSGTGSSTTPFRYGACRSVTIRRGRFAGFPRRPVHHDFPSDSSQNWQESGAGPLPSMAFRFDLEGMDNGSSPGIHYKNSAGQNIGAGLLAYGSSGNPNALGVVANPHYLKYGQMSQLATSPPTFPWPPWAQRNDINYMTEIETGFVWPLIKLPDEGFAAGDSPLGNGVRNYSPAVNGLISFGPSYKLKDPAVNNGGAPVTGTPGPASVAMSLGLPVVTITINSFPGATSTATSLGLPVVSTQVLPKPTGTGGATKLVDPSVDNPVEISATATSGAVSLGLPSVSNPQNVVFAGSTELEVESPASFLVQYAPQVQTGPRAPGEGGVL